MGSEDVAALVAALRGPVEPEKEEGGGVVSSGWGGRGRAEPNAKPLRCGVQRDQGEPCIVWCGGGGGEWRRTRLNAWGLEGSRENAGLLGARAHLLTVPCRPCTQSRPVQGNNYDRK